MLEPTFNYVSGERVPMSQVPAADLRGYIDGTRFGPAPGEDHDFNLRYAALILRQRVPA